MGGGGYVPDRPRPRRHVVPAGVGLRRNSERRGVSSAREATSADAHRLIRLANEGDAQAAEILNELAGYLGSGVGSFVNVFAPELVLLGGGFGVAAYDYLAAAVEEVARREALEPMRGAFRLAKAELGTSAGLIGAAFVGFEALDSA